MDTELKPGDKEKVLQRFQTLSNLKDRILEWDTLYYFMLSPIVQTKDLDPKRDFDTLHKIIDLGNYVLMMLTRIQSFCVTALIESHIQCQRHQIEPFSKLDVNKQNMIRSYTVRQQLWNEYLAMQELYHLLNRDKVAFRPTDEDLRTSDTMNQTNHDATTIKALMKKTDDTIYYLSYLQTKIAQKVWDYQQVVKNSIKRPEIDVPSAQPSSTNKRRKVCHVSVNIGECRDDESD